MPRKTEGGFNIFQVKLDFGVKTQTEIVARR